MTIGAPEPKFRRLGPDEVPSSPRPMVALVPAGGEVWEDFLDTIGVTLEEFCAQGPGGWMLGYIEALASAGIDTLLVFFSGQVDRPTRYVDPGTRAVITVLPVRAGYMRWRGRVPTYRQALAGQTKRGLRGALARVVGAALSHSSAPLGPFLAELRRFQCRAIIAQEYEYFRFDLCVVAGRRLGIPVVATFQGGTSEANILSRVWKPALLRRASALVVPAAQEAARVRSRYGPGPRIVPIFNPVNLADWTGQDGREAERARLGLGPDSCAVVWHGRIAIHVKGLDILLQAWDRICAARLGRDIHLILTGTGEDADAFGKMVAARNGQNIRWDNRYVTDREALRRFLAAGDVYAFASRLEGFPVAPIEAMACGLPVVGTNASGVSEIVGEGKGLQPACVPAGDPEAFATALGRLVDDPDLARQIGAAARRRVEAEFSVEAVGLQLAQLLLPDDTARSVA